MLKEIQLALDLFDEKKEAARAALEACKAAEAAHIATIPANFMERRAEDVRARLEETQAEYLAAKAAHERAARISRAAGYIARKRIEAAAAPVILAVLEKYAGKPAGPKTRDKAAADGAAGLGLDVGRVYFTSDYSGGDIRTCVISLPQFQYKQGPEVSARYPGRMIDAENRFCIPDELNAPGLDKLPADLEAWADEFEAAAAELEAAREAFEAAASKARRVNLGPVELPPYRITR